MDDMKLHFNKESGKYKCNYCGHDFAANSCRTRLEDHLIGVLNTSTKSCPNVPDDVRRVLSLCELKKRPKKASIWASAPPKLVRGHVINCYVDNLLRDDDMVIKFLNDANNEFGNQRGVLKEPYETGSRNFRLINQSDRSGVTFELNSPVNVEGGDIAMDDRQEPEYMDDGNVMRHLRNDNEKSWVCKYCRHPFPWQVRHQTFVHHLTTICKRAPEDVKEAAKRAEGNDSNFNTYTQTTYGSSNAESAVGAAECSISVNQKPKRILDASQDNESSFEAETEGSNDECQEIQGAEEEVSSVQGTRREGIIVQKGNKRQESTSDALPIEVPRVEGTQDSGDSTSLTKRPRRI